MGVWNFQREMRSNPHHLVLFRKHYNCAVSHGFHVSLQLQSEIYSISLGVFSAKWGLYYIIIPYRFPIFCARRGLLHITRCFQCKTRSIIVQFYVLIFRTKVHSTSCLKTILCFIIFMYLWIWKHQSMWDFISREK